MHATTLRHFVLPGMLIITKLSLKENLRSYQRKGNQPKNTKIKVA